MIKFSSIFTLFLHLQSFLFHSGFQTSSFKVTQAKFYTNTHTHKITGNTVLVDMASQPSLF